MPEAPGDQAPPPASASIWQLKPWWCQPWSILLTGVLLIVGSWAWLHLWWVTAPVGAAVTLWWWLFLVLMPRQVAALSEHGNMG